MPEWSINPDSSLLLLCLGWFRSLGPTRAALGHFLGRGAIGIITFLLLLLALDVGGGGLALAGRGLALLGSVLVADIHRVVGAAAAGRMIVVRVCVLVLLLVRLADGLELGLDAGPVGAGTFVVGVLSETGELVQLDLKRKGVVSYCYVYEDARAKT